MLILSTLALAPVPLCGQKAPTHDYTAADVAFVQGMILHHAQAVEMSSMAPTHAASPALRTLARRIGLSQRDEIAMMQRWLEERHLAVPDPLHTLAPSARGGHSMRPGEDSAMREGGLGARDTTNRGMGMLMPGMATPNDSTPLMPGMLTPAQMRQLDSARGTSFDTLYLTGMIRHHEGALDMVHALFHTPGGGEQPDLFGFATDVDAGQRVEIARMQELLNTLTQSQTR